MRHIQGYIDVETIQIMLDGAEERLERSETLIQRIFIYGMIEAYTDLIKTHEQAWEAIKK